MTKKQTNTVKNFIKQLEVTKSQIDRTISKCKNRTNEKMMLISELIDKCSIMDQVYEEDCNYYDSTNNLEIGTTYEDGMGKGDEWFEISLILRRLEELNK